MRYIYFDPEIKTITISANDTGAYGEVIGTNKTWRDMNPGTKKLLLATLLKKVSSLRLTEVIINDCDNLPKEPQ